MRHSFLPSVLPRLVPFNLTLQLLGCTHSSATGAAASPAPRTAHQAAAAGDLRALEKLLAGGVPVDSRNGEGDTPLRYAAAGGHTEAIASLLRRGAGVNATNNVSCSSRRGRDRWDVLVSYAAGQMSVTVPHRHWHAVRRLGTAPAHFISSESPSRVTRFTPNTTPNPLARPFALFCLMITRRSGGARRCTLRRWQTSPSRLLRWWLRAALSACGTARGIRRLSWPCGRGPRRHSRSWRALAAM
jgi:hypothetical protein